ncbi:galactosyltransferase-related protein, partial [Planctopirus hydrillae]|uniref:galactosyltransferase-related protein n=1 Tax=Planctopirus hydrillae TaxID=1841610 RepID=UPI00197C17CD
RLYHQPALIGCVLAVSRETYFALGGFDTGMKVWGVEDIDFGLKASRPGVWGMASSWMSSPALPTASSGPSTIMKFLLPTSSTTNCAWRPNTSPPTISNSGSPETPPSHSNSFLLPPPTCREHRFLLPLPVCRERAGVRASPLLHQFPTCRSLPSGVLPSISSTSISPASRQSVRWFKAAACGMNSTMLIPSSLTGPATYHPSPLPWP